MYVIKAGFECVDWIQLVQDRNQWHTSVKMIVKIRILGKAGDFSGHLSIYHVLRLILKI